MQGCPNEFVVWAYWWQLQVAEHKCCVLTIGNITLTTYHLKGVQLIVIVDDKCLFKQHILSICHKVYSTINVIFRCFHTTNIDALIKAYKSFARPVLEYCSMVRNPYIPARHYLCMTDQSENVQRFFMHQVYYRCQLDINHGYIQRLVYILN